MKKSFYLLLIICTSLYSFSQEKSSDKRFNHVLSIGVNNSMFFNSIKGINDPTGYSKKQFIPGLELGYLFSYQLKKKIELKAGLNVRSFIRNVVTYYGNSRRYSISNPNIPILVEFHPFNHSPLFISSGIKLSLELSENVWEDHSSATNTTPQVIMSETINKGINPMLSLGIGKKKIIREKYKFEWIFSYNHGTNSLRTYKYIRFDPYIESTFKAYNSHISLLLRYYLK